MKAKIKALIGIVCLVISFTLTSYFLAFPASADPLTIISYNVESDDLNDTDPVLVSQDIEKIGERDLWGLSEVAGTGAARIFRNAISTFDTQYESILGTTGALDKLQIVYNPEKLDLIDSEELEGSGGTREPLVAHFKLRSNDREFLFTVNHFNRGDEEKRNKQASFLREWAKNQTIPVIAVGDYNFDFDPQTKAGNKAFDTLLEDETFTWIEPQCLADGTCPSTGTQCNSQFNSILDFVFVSGKAKNWDAESDVLFINDPVCPRESRGFSDHRPVFASFDIP